MNPGEKVYVFNRPLQHSDLEGIAILVKPEPPLYPDAKMGERWLVQFNGHPPVIRWVNHSDRVEEMI